MQEIERLDIKILPKIDSVLLKNIDYGEERSLGMIKFVLSLSERKIQLRAEKTLMHFNCRHRSVTRIFLKSYKKVEHLVKKATSKELPYLTKILIGSYFTMEYSLQGSALFNPSIVLAPNQIDLPLGYIRVILSFRAIGEGHISSLIFKGAIIDLEGNVDILPTGSFIEEATRITKKIITKNEFLENIKKINDKDNYINKFFSSSMVPETFNYDQIKGIINDEKSIDDKEKKELEKVLWLAEPATEISFSYDSDISERIIFPISRYEKNGIEDVRFVKFDEEDKYYGTYTAFDGKVILPKLIETKDFVKFKTSPLHGNAAINKNIVFFPRKINGKYAALARIDGVNIYLMYSNHPLLWENAIKILEPKHTWERVQMGVCGAPIEIDEGWLVIGHGVGPVREYCLSAIILKKDNPSKVIARLQFPLMKALESERNGYVPNVLYSCGAIVHGENLIIPYAQSDYSSSIARIKLESLIAITMDHGN